MQGLVVDLESGQPVERDVSDADESCQCIVGENGDVTKVVFAHELGDVRDRVLRRATDDGRGHQFTDGFLGQRRSMGLETAHDVASRNHAVQIAAFIGDGRRADLSLDDHPRELVHRHFGLDGDDVVALDP
jgi:hypothetical protein